MSTSLYSRYSPSDAARWVARCLPAAAQGLPIQAMGLPASGPSLLELECGVCLQGRPGGLLVLRCPRILAADLAQAAEGRAAARLLAKEALSALTERLVQAMLADGVFGLPPQAAALPAAGIRVWEWPQSPPALEHLLIVGEHPLELRLWVEGSHA